MIALFILSWLGVWSSVPNAIPPLNLTLNPVQKDVARVSGFFSVERKEMLPKPEYSNEGEGFLTRGLVAALAEVAHANASAVEYHIGDVSTLWYVITFIGDQVEDDAKERALMAVERLKSEDSTSMMVRSLDIWPRICRNESAYLACHPIRYDISWMGAPELSLPAPVVAWPPVFEEKEVWVTIQTPGQDCGGSWQDVACGNTFLDAANLVERMSNLSQQLEAMIPTCSFGRKRFWSRSSWSGTQPWRPWARCWNQTGSSWTCHDDRWSNPGPSWCRNPDTSGQCRVLLCEFGFELCDRSVSQIRNQLEASSLQKGFNMSLQVTAGPKAQSFTCRHVLEVISGSDLFADVGCTPDGFDPALFINPQIYTSHAWLQNRLLEKGLAWKSRLHMNESGLFYGVRLRAMGQGNSANGAFTWVNFTSRYTNWRCRNTWGCNIGLSDWWMSRVGPAQVVMEWNVKIVFSDPNSQPWQMPEKIQIPCLVEMQEHRVALVFPGNSTHPLIGMNGNFSTFQSSFGITTSRSDDLVLPYVGDLPSVRSRETQAKYRMPREDLLDWRARQNLTFGEPEGAMLRIEAGPTPGSLELSILPQAGGPSTEGQFCFIPADGFHIYPELCSEYFPIRAQASACAAMTAETTAKTVVPASILFSLLVLFAYMF